MVRRLLLAASTGLALAAPAHAAGPDVPGLPSGPADVGEVVTRDGGRAVVVTDAPAGTDTLYGGPADGPVRALATCERTQEETPDDVAPVVSGGTVAWLPCDSPTVDVFDAGGARSVAPGDGGTLRAAALAGRTLAVFEATSDERFVLRLLDLDSGAERRVPIAGRGPLVHLDGQADGTVVATRSSTSLLSADLGGNCPRSVTSVVVPGATSASRPNGIDCSDRVLVAGGRLVFYDRARRVLRSTNLDGSGIANLDRGLAELPRPSLRSDGSTLTWRHRGCRANRTVRQAVGQPSNAGESCPVRVRDARLSGDGRRLSLVVVCPRGCHEAQVGVGLRPRQTRDVRLRTPGRRRVRLPLLRSERRAIRDGRVQLSLGGSPYVPAGILVRVRRG